MNAHHKFSSQTISADYTLEVEVKLSGTYSPAERMTRDDPGCEAGVEDIDIEEIGALRLVIPPIHEAASHRLVWRTVDLLDGVDRNSDAYRQIVANLLAFIGEDTAADTLLGEVA